MVQPGWRKPTNKVCQNGGGLDTEQLKVGANATAAKMLPGIVVIRDSNDYSVKEWSSGGYMIGYLSYENSPKKPETIDSAYAVGDLVGVEIGANRRQLARLAISQTIVKGQPLTVTTDGYLAAATVGTDDIVADAEESVTTTSSTAKIWVRTRK
jgi:hypothetical protein